MVYLVEEEVPLALQQDGAELQAEPVDAGSGLVHGLQRQPQKVFQLQRGQRPAAVGRVGRRVQHAQRRLHHAPTVAPLPPSIAKMNRLVLLPPLDGSTNEH